MVASRTDVNRRLLRKVLAGSADILEARVDVNMPVCDYLRYVGGATEAIAVRALVRAGASAG